MSAKMSQNYAKISQELHMHISVVQGCGQLFHMLNVGIFNGHVGVERVPDDHLGQILCHFWLVFAEYLDIFADISRCIWR